MNCTVLMLDTHIVAGPSAPSATANSRRAAWCFGLFMAFNTAGPSPQELVQLTALRAELALDLAAVPDSHEEQKDDWKLLRFLRGHGAKAAAGAYRRRA